MQSFYICFFSLQHNIFEFPLDLEVNLNKFTSEINSNPLSVVNFFKKPTGSQFANSFFVTLINFED